MFATTHILAAVAISQHVPNPWWAFVVSLVSHYILDLIPHGDAPLGPWMVSDPKKRRMAYVLGADGIVSLVLLAIFWQTKALPKLVILLPALIGSILPDLLWFIGFAYRKFFPMAKQAFLMASLEHMNNFHHKVHSFFDHDTKRIWPGILIQAAVFSGLVYFVISWRS